MEHFKNLQSYSELNDKISLAEEPLIALNHKKRANKKIGDLLSYEGLHELQIPGSFLSIVTELTSLPITHIIDILDISKSTFYRAKEGKNLEQSTIDKLASLLKIYNRGIKAFGDMEDFSHWLKSKIPTLGGNRPLDLLKSENGRLAILDAIDRIEYGVYG